MNTEQPTRGIVNCRCSGYSSGTARIKSSCNLIGKCFEIGNCKPSLSHILTKFPGQSILRL